MPPHNLISQQRKAALSNEDDIEPRDDARMTSPSATANPTLRVKRITAGGGAEDVFLGTVSFVKLQYDNNSISGRPLLPIALSLV